MSRMADWIRKQMDKGYSPRQIKDELVSEGYSLSTINAAFEELGTRARNAGKTEEDEENSLNVDIPEEIPLLKVGGGIFLILVLIGIVGMMVQSTGSSLTPANSNFQSVESGAVEDYEQFYTTNQKVLIEQDRLINSEMSINSEDSDMESSTVETTARIKEGGNRIVIITESAGGLVQDFTERRFANEERIWTERVNTEYDIPGEAYSNREKSSGLDDINFAGEPFTYIIAGDFDEIKRNEDHYVFKADSLRTEDNSVQEYSATLRVTPDGMIENGEVSITSEEDSMMITREISYSVETDDVNVEIPTWVR